MGLKMKADRVRWHGYWYCAACRRRGRSCKYTHKRIAQAWTKVTTRAQARKNADPDSL